MTGILDSLLGILIPLMIPSFIIGVIGAFFAIYARSKKNAAKKKPWKLAKILLGQAAILFLLVYGISTTINYKSRLELKDLLEQQNVEIFVDGKKIDEKKIHQMVVELKNIEPYFGHHSHPEKEFELKVSSDNRQMILSVKQDSEIKNEYWIFWNKYFSTSQNEIGRITSEIF